MFKLTQGIGVCDCTEDQINYRTNSNQTPGAYGMLHVWLDESKEQIVIKHMKRMLGHKCE